MEASAPGFAPGLQAVQAYRAGGFTIAGVRHVGSVLVFPDRVLPWAAPEPGALVAADLAAVRTVQPVPDILVLGLGAEFVLLPPALRAAVRAWGPVLEVMATPAACRTYNVLLAEQRRVAAALITLPG
jgi:uncharacterized protein